jgi:hypothetical protein
MAWHSAETFLPSLADYPPPPTPGGPRRRPDGNHRPYACTNPRCDRRFGEFAPHTCPVCDAPVRRRPGL